MNDKYAALRVISHDIAKHLGGTVEANPEVTHGFHIQAPTYRLWFHYSTRQEKVLVSLSIPKHRNFYGEWTTLQTSEVLTYEERQQGAVTTSIGCSLEKGAAAIAKDVTRRLIPQCSELMERARKLYAERDESARRISASANEFKAMFGYTERERRPGELYPSSGLPRLTVTASAKSVQFERFSCSEDSALLILEILKGEESTD